MRMWDRKIWMASYAEKKTNRWMIIGVDVNNDAQFPAGHRVHSQESLLPRSPSCRSRRPERMKSAPRNVRQAASLSMLPGKDDSRSPRQAGSLSDIFRGGNLFDHKNTEKNTKTTNILQVSPSPSAS